MSTARNSIWAAQFFRPFCRALCGLTLRGRGRGYNYILKFSWFPRICVLSSVPFFLPCIFYHNLLFLFVCQLSWRTNCELKTSKTNGNYRIFRKPKPKTSTNPGPKTWTIWLTVRVIIIFFKSVCANFSLCQSFAPPAPSIFATANNFVEKLPPFPFSLSSTDFSMLLVIMLFVRRWQTFGYIV